MGTTFPMPKTGPEEFLNPTCIPLELSLAGQPKELGFAQSVYESSKAPLLISRLLIFLLLKKSPRSLPLKVLSSKSL